MKLNHVQSFRPDPRLRRLDSDELRQAIEFWLYAGLSSATVKDALALLQAVQQGKLSYLEAKKRLTP